MGKQIEDTIESLQRKFVQVKKVGEDTVAKVARLCAMFAKMNMESIPSADDLCNDPATLEFFLRRASTSFEMQEAAQRADTRKLEMAAKAAQSSTKKTTLTPAIAKAVQGFQGRVAELTRTLHQDHKQLIDALTLSTDDIDFS